MAEDRMGSARRAVTAFFDERAAAQAAVDDLAAAGIPRDRITLVEGQARPVQADAVPTAARGVWETVKDLFMAEEDRHAYGEGLRRGGFLLSVMTAGDDARVVEILDREGAVDMDARQGDWELEGWDPARASQDLKSASLAQVQAAVEPVGAVGPAFGHEGGTSPSVAPEVAAMSAGEIRTAVEPVGAVGPAFGHDEEPSGTAIPPAAIPAGEAQAAMEPVGAVGPAFGAGQAPAPQPVRRTVTRDAEAEGLRLRTYVESHEHPDATR